MTRSKLVSRLAPHVVLLNILPLALLIVPAAVLANLLIFYRDTAFFQTASYLCAAVAIFGGSMSMIILPEIVRVSGVKLSTLLQGVALAITILGLLMAIGILLASKLQLQGLLLVALIVGGALGAFYTFRHWTIWMAK